jgi:undecaprenyl diphosphate synthase
MMYSMQNKMPQHIGIIMDGNRRWARAKGLPTFEGHRIGVETFKKVGQWCLERGIKYLTVFTFSTENWNRPEKEIDYLFELFKSILRNEIDALDKKGVRFNVLGRIEGFPKVLQQEMRRAMAKTKKNAKAIFSLALNYGGRAEIVDAVKKIIAKRVKPERITEEFFGKFLYAPEIPDPDLIIRTSGELRTSGFLLWEAAYSELYFCDKYWPDFSEKDLDEAIEEFGLRQRRFGK